jgi:hypothetical protein
MIYYCPFCGGQAPKSKRAALFHKLTQTERGRLTALVKDMRVVSEVIAAFGEPDFKFPVGTGVTTPEKDGKPETTHVYGSMIYNRLSETANVYVTIFPPDRVGFSFLGKARKKSTSA